MAYRVTECLGWRDWVTPRRAKGQPVHRWYLFPHSFTAELVHALVDEWSLSEHDKILDPFVGAGTTLVAAKERGIGCKGYDLSPLAVFASNTKAAGVGRPRLERAWIALRKTLERDTPTAVGRGYPQLVKRALPEGRLQEFEGIASRIDQVECGSSERDFFRLALLSVIPRFSYAVANGGWLRWISESAGTEPVADAFRRRVEVMLSDVGERDVDTDKWKASIGDVRSLPDVDASYSAVITSPPYPNRHDYTRVFGIELMFQFLDWERVRKLRYQSFHSHPESRPKRPFAEEYRPPATLEARIEGLDDVRIQRMLRGYFLDMFLCLRELSRVCRDEARIGVVVGNARYNGTVIPVDEYTAELGERAKLCCSEIRVVRWRGNSAQQMGKFGRVASRESIVVFKKREHWCGVGVDGRDETQEAD